MILIAHVARIVQYPSIYLLYLLRSCLENLSQYLFPAGIYTTLMTLKWAMTKLFQDLAIMLEAQQEIKKEEFDIARSSNTYRRLWRPFPCIT
jgi:hypothetical protein